MKQYNDPSIYGKEKIYKILLKIAPPVMFALLIQSLYNVVDSFYVGKYDPSGDGLTALSVIYTVQLIITALAVGTGVGVNTYMAKLYAEKKDKEANETAGCGIVLSLITWLLFSLVTIFLLEPYINLQINEERAKNYAYIYGMIVSVGSVGLYSESIFSKVYQAEGNMLLPTIAQVTGAVINVILDPVLIFGWWIFPELGIAGAAIATVTGQIAAAVITGIKGFRKSPPLKKYGFYMKKIYKLGYPSILMQLMFTVYILALNIILSGFCDEATTVLGLYYKVQSFFWIPLIGLQTCIVPVISYNYANKRYDRVRGVMRYTFGICAAMMIIGIVCFEFFPVQILSLFSGKEKVFEIGKIAFRIIGLSFIPAIFSMMIPVFFQAIGKAVPSVALTLSHR